MRFLTSTLLAFLILSQYAFGLAERDFRSKNGQVIKGTIIKYFEDGDVLLKRSKDLQMFRISLEIFTEDDQAFVKNNFPPITTLYPNSSVLFPSSFDDQLEVH